MHHEGPPRPLAVRLISRHASEMGLSALAVVERFLPSLGDAAIVALVILRTCLRDWIGKEGLCRPDTLTIGASINAAATSLGHPYATVHRLVGKLRALGLVVQMDNGFAISRDDQWAPAVLRFLEEANDVFLRFVEELRDADQIDVSLYAASRRPPVLELTGTTLDVFLMPFEVYRGRMGDWTSTNLWVAISTFTIRHVTIDPELNARYAYQSTPNSERRPVPSADLCRVTTTSAATAWRHCNAMEAAGRVTKADQGWLICTQELLEARMEAAVQGAVAFYVRRIEELMAGGFNPAAIRFVHGRPPLVPYTSQPPSN